MAIDVHRAHTADTLAAVVVKCYGLLTLVDEVVVRMSIISRNEVSDEMFSTL